jgi:hypothetical protein
MSEKSAWEKYKEKNGTTPLDMLNPNAKKVSNEDAEARLEICNSCPELIKLTSQCKQCGCFMKMKTKFEVAKCPLKKW